MSQDLPPPLPGRNPAQLLERTRARWGGRGELWIFGYASLIWRQEFKVVEQRSARVHGWHRALRTAGCKPRHARCHARAARTR